MVFSGGLGYGDPMSQFEENSRKHAENRPRRGPWQWYMGEGRVWYKQPWRWSIFITVGIPFFRDAIVGWWQVAVTLFK